jgi:hypothetical protein
VDLIFFLPFFKSFPTIIKQFEATNMTQYEEDLEAVKQSGYALDLIDTDKFKVETIYNIEEK